MKINLPLATNFNEVIISGLCFAQPKIDGVRAVATRSNGMIHLYTRQGKEIENCNHIKKELSEVLQEGYFLDGELFYSDFQKSLSDFRQTGENLSFIVFDYWNEELKMNLYERRYDALEKLFGTMNHIKIIPMLQRKIKPFEAHEYMKHFVSLGYEGIILRKNEIWQGGRTESIVKLKKFLDEEFICQGVERTEKSFVAYFETNDGKSFSTKATAQFFKEKKKYIGKRCTVRFQEYSSKGIPRFPILQTCRNYE